MNRQQHIAYLRSLDKHADDVENETTSTGTSILDMVAAEVHSRKADVLRSSAHLARAGLLMARSSADSALTVRNAMDQVARQPPPRIGGWSRRRAMRRSLSQVQAWACTCEHAADEVAQAQDRLKFEL